MYLFISCKVYNIKTFVKKENYDVYNFTTVMKSLHCSEWYEKSTYNAVCISMYKSRYSFHILIDIMGIWNLTISNKKR